MDHMERTKAQKIWGDGGATQGRHKGDHTIQNYRTTEVNTDSLPSVEIEADHKFSDWDLKAAEAAEGRLIAAGHLDRELTDAHREKWADEFRKLRLIDEKSEKLIAYVMHWLFEVDDFWVSSGNFCSVLKLRRKDKDGTKFFKRFEIAAKASETTGRSPRNGRRGRGSHAHEVALAMAESSFRQGSSD